MQPPDGTPWIGPPDYFTLGWSLHGPLGVLTAPGFWGP